VIFVTETFARYSGFRLTAFWPSSIDSINLSVLCVTVACRQHREKARDKKATLAVAFDTGM
jgi:hypothetical protein